MKRKITARFLSFLLGGLLLAAAGVSAQNVAYRQTNLASDINTPGIATHVNASLQNTWGLAVVPHLSFFVVNTNNGIAIELDATGSGTGPAGFAIPNAGGTDRGIPVPAIADPDLIFGAAAAGQRPMISILAATLDGGIDNWIVDSQGNFLTNATLVVNHSRDGAVYTGLAILKPTGANPILAAANFHSGQIEFYDSNFAAVTTIHVPGLPPGFAPYGLQIIGTQLFVTSALQDAAKKNPVPGAGNGLVSVLDLQGRFVRQFAAAGPLDAPWGIAQASANFGPFSNDILIGNVGDGTINAFDPASGNFAGQLKDGDGLPLVNGALHALAFRSDGIGDPDTLYFTAAIGDLQDGLFGAISAGLVSTTRVSVAPTPIGEPFPITVTVAAGPGNTGMPTGNVIIRDSGATIANVALQNVTIVIPAVLTGAGAHTIEARYQGDAAFLPSTSSTEVDVTLLLTTLTLSAPASAAPGATVELTATTNSGGGIPTGQITFHDGGVILGTASLDGAGVAVIRINTLAAGAHTLTASYAGDARFAVSTSAAVVTTVAGRDFSVVAAPPAATVTAGQSTSFALTLTPTGGFTDQVTFSCSSAAGITCAFNPPMVTPNGGMAATMLTVTTSAGVTRYGRTGGSPASGIPLAGFGLMAILIAFKKTVRHPHAAFLRAATGALTVITLSLALVSCGGYTTGGQTSRGTASVTVTAQSGAISHTAVVQVTVQ